MAAERADEDLRVLFLITDLLKGGAERFLLDLAGELRSRGDVSFVIGTLLEGNAYAELSAGLPIESLGYVPFSFRRPQGCAKYRDLLRGFRPHVIHTHRYLAEFLSARHLSDTAAYVCHGHDAMVELVDLSRSTLDRRGFTNWLEKRYLIRAKYRPRRTVFAANSSHTLAYYQRVLPRFMREDVVLAPYGFDYHRFSSSPLPQLPGSGPLRLINVGSFVDKKNQAFLVAVARSLRDAGVDFRIELVGDGVNRAAVRALVEREHLGDLVSLPGSVDRVEDRLCQSHVYVHAATYEPFGLVILEAMAAGLPCVVLDGKGNRDLIENAQNGYLLATEDADHFAARIVSLAGAPDVYAAMSRAARDFAARYDIATATERFVSLYRRLAADRRENSKTPGSSLQQLFA